MQRLHITNLDTLVANYLFLSQKLKEMVALTFWARYSQMRRAHFFFFFLSFFIYLLLLIIYFALVWCCCRCCCFLFCFLVFCCFTVLSKHFIINLQLIWAEIIPVLCSNPDSIVTIWRSVLVTITKVRISIVSCIVCNVDIMASKCWKIVIFAVRGVLIVVAYVLFKISITIVVFQWV